MKSLFAILIGFTLLALCGCGNKPCPDRCLCHMPSVGMDIDFKTGIVNKRVAALEAKVVDLERKMAAKPVCPMHKCPAKPKITLKPMRPPLATVGLTESSSCCPNPSMPTVDCPCVIPGPCKCAKCKCHPGPNCSCKPCECGECKCEGCGPCPDCKPSPPRSPSGGKAEAAKRGGSTCKPPLQVRRVRCR